jgi:hypothetical protein
VALEFVAVTVAQPSRIHTGFPDIGLHYLAEIFRHFKERFLFTPDNKFFQAKFFMRGKLASSPEVKHNISSIFL